MLRQQVRSGEFRLIRRNLLGGHREVKLQLQGRFHCESSFLPRSCFAAIRERRRSVRIHVAIELLIRDGTRVALPSGGMVRINLTDKDAPPEPIEEKTMVTANKNGQLLASRTCPSLRTIHTERSHVRHDWNVQERASRRERAVRSQRKLMELITAAYADVS